MSKPILILSGPSGSGKSSLVKKLSNVIENYYFSISSTTREKRDTEVDGVDYHFVSKEQFEEDIKNDVFLEYANVMGNYYGTSRTYIDEAIKQNKLVILDIDVQGRMQIVEKIPDLCTSVFVTTLSQKILEQRLIDRNLDEVSVIQKRVKHSIKEMQYLNKYDYILINDDLDDTFESFLSIIKTMKIDMSNSDIENFKEKWSNI